MQREKIVVMLLLASLLAAASVNGQIPTELLTDPTGDVSGATALGAGAVLPQGVRDQTDLLSLTATENAEAIDVLLEVKSVDRGIQYWADLAFGFQHLSTEFRVLMPGTDLAGEIAGSLLAPGNPPANIERRAAGSDIWVPVETLEAAKETGTRQGWTVSIPRALLTDEDGSEPFAGRSLDAFWATAVDWQCLVATCMESGFKDYMPDEGTGEVPLELQLGSSTDQQIRLTSPRPLRSSNGEEGTFVFEVFVSAIDGNARDVYFEATGLPQGWSVDLSASGARLEPGQPFRLIAIASTPFAHQHGVTESFDIAATDIADETVRGSIDVGIHYLEVPQPAGHHSLLWIHKRNPIDGNPLLPGFGDGHRPNAIMNTVQDYATDTAGPIGPDEDTQTMLPTDSSYRYVWCVRLGPSLSLGLDMDLNAMGSFHGDLYAPTPVEGDLSGRLLIVGKHEFPTQTECSDDKALEIAALPSLKVNLDSDPQEISLDIKPMVDLVEDRQFQNLVLELVLNARGPTFRLFDDQPLIAPGASLGLPLLEYHDPIPVTTDSGPKLTVVGDFKTQRNPGDIAVFEVEASEGGRYEFDITGTRPEWVRLIQMDGTSASIIVTIPGDAPDNAIADYIVRASNVETAAFARIVVEVDLDEEHPTDAEEAASVESQYKETSTPWLFSIVGMFGISAILRRTGHRAT